MRSFVESVHIERSDFPATYRNTSIIRQGNFKRAYDNGQWNIMAISPARQALFMAVAIGNTCDPAFFSADMAAFATFSECPEKRA